MRDRSLRTALSIIALVVLGYLSAAGFNAVAGTPYKIPYIIVVALVLAVLAAFLIRMALRTREQEVSERHQKAADHHAAMGRNRR